MRITNLRRRVAAALMAAGLAVPGVASAAPLDTNLVVNPSFENVDSNTAGAYGSVLILDWQGNGFAYNYSQGYDNGGPLAGGGDYYFNGGNGDGGQPIFQDIDLSTGASAAEIAAGTAGYDVSAFFSSYLTQGDFGNVTVRFLDAGEVELGSGTLSDSDTSTWTSETLRGAIPQGTALVRLESQGTSVAGDPDGYVDLVDFRVVHGLAALQVNIDQTTGAVSLTNGTAAPVQLQGYSIRSASGALDPAAWRPIAGNYDANGNGTVDGDDAWRVLTDTTDPTYGDLSEFQFGGNGATLAVNQTIDLGSGAWIQNAIEAPSDLVFQYTTNSGEQVEGAVLAPGDPLQLGDLNYDGLINSADWTLFKAGQQADMAGLSLAQAYQLGDLDGDLQNNHPDFVLFKGAFDAENGPGALAAMLASVPEPSTMVLLVCGALGALACLRRPHDVS